ncbi:MAG: MBL fold metallo-hydrolase [Candidatus Cloacimonetes bacterium]|nr:MBL fold metallo-hydrolase [Candidatus Cloacimonadota bacterium]
MKFIYFVLVSLFASTLLAHSPGFDLVKIKIEPVGGNVWVAFGAGGNIGLSVGEDGILMIDDQFAPLAEKIKIAIKEKFNKKIKYVVNTHWHGDHTGGNEAFSKLAPIIAQKNVKKRLKTAQKRGDKIFPKRPRAAWPTLSYEKSLAIEFNNEEIICSHLPDGHTDGDSIIYFTKSKVLHLGDHFFTERFPFIDVHSGGSVNGYLKNLEYVLGTFDQDTKLIPGHGKLSSMSDLKVFRQMISDTSKIVQNKKSKGQSLESIIKEGLGEKFKSYSWGFIPEKKWIKTLYVGSLK